MNLKLTIEASAAVLAQILATLPDGATIGNAAGAGPGPSFVPLAPAPAPVAMAATSGIAGIVAPIDDDDDNGAVNTAAPAVDTTGLPWDERIHAKTKATTEKGTWRKRRGVDDATVAAVEAQLRAGAVAPAPVPMPAPVPAPMAIPAMPAVAPIAAPVPAPMAPAPAPVAMPAPIPAIPPMPAVAPVEELEQAPAPVTGTLDFGQFMQHLAGQMTKRDAIGAPLVHADYLASLTAEIAGAFQSPLTAITDIAPNPQMITFAQQAMSRDGRW